MNIVIIDCFDTWEHRVDLLTKTFSDEGHNVTVLMSDYRHIDKIRRYEKKERFILFTAEPYKKNMSVRRLHSHIQFSRDIFQWVEVHEKNIDLLWVLAPPNSLVRDASEIKKHHQHIKLIVDLIDLWPETMPIGVIKPLLRPWEKLRDDNLKFADIIVTECNLYEKVLGKVLHGKRVETLYLAREDKGDKPNLCIPTDKIALCYLGSINNIIDIDIISALIEVCGKIKPVLLHIVGDGEKKHKLIKKSKIAGAEVIDHGKIYDRSIKKHIFDSCHYGLNIMKTTVCVGLTMKSIDYFEFGLPIINNIKGDTWEAIEKYGCGINIDKGINILHKKEILNHEWYINRRKNSREFFASYLTEDVFRRKLIHLI